jgi:hypothetical protein
MKIGESAKDRRVLVREAGFRPTSGISVVAGICAAFGLMAVATGVGAAVADAAGLHTDAWSRHDWRVAGTIAAAIGVVVVFGSFFLGGYTAGRMSRRMGFRHGVLVFVGTAVAIAAVVGIAAATGAWTDLRDRLADNDVPVGSGTWSGIGVVAAIAAAGAMLLGAITGGVNGDRWHTRLTAAAERKRERDEEVPATAEAQPTRELGRDATSIDLRDETEATEPSVEEERENARTARADVGL